MRGTDLVCPKGFVPEPAAGDAEPDCTADATVCGEDPFGGVAEAPGVVFVDAAFNGPSAGTRAAPYKSLAQGVEAAPAGGTVAVAAGTYAGGLLVGKPLQLLGRCAALVHIVSPAGESALVVKAGADGSTVRGMRLTGGTDLLYVSMAKKVSLQHLWIESAQLTGLSVVVNAQATLSDSVVARTVGDKSDVDAGTGIAVADAVLGVHRVRVTRNRGFGVVIFDGALVDMQDSLIDEGNPTQAKGPAGMGAFVGAGSSMTVARSRVHRNGAAGFKVKGKGSALTMTRVAITATRPWWTVAKTHGIGIHGQHGAQVTLDAGLVHDNRMVGAIIEGDPGGSLTLRRTRVSGTRPPPEALFGPGVSAIGEVAVALEDVTLQDNEYYSVLLELKASAVLRSVRITGNRMGSKPNDYSSALAVFTGAKANLEDVHFWENTDSALRAADLGVSVVGRRVLIAHTSNRGLDDQMVAPGLYVQDGAQVWLHDSRIHGSEGVGVLASGDATALRLSAAVLDANKPLRSNGNYGLALVAQNGVLVELLGVRATGNHGAAVVVDQPDARIVAHGLAVDHTLPRISDAGGGHAIYGAHGAALDLTAAWVVDNFATGIAVDKSALRADRAVVRLTRFAHLIDPDRRQIKVALGDALLGVHATLFEVGHSLIVDNQRAGLLLDSTLGAKLTGSLVARGTFGVVTQNGTGLGATGNLIYGHSQQNLVGDGGLAVPEPPGLAGK
ncbi:MAG: hypothetical protein FJ100_17390 [Deltaproteobacteria bacterium]|nr:hypothetical protein [Deltaproteobacteria bacterium]